MVRVCVSSSRKNVSRSTKDRYVSFSCVLVYWYWRSAVQRRLGNRHADLRSHLLRIRCTVVVVVVVRASHAKTRSVTRKRVVRKEKSTAKLYTRAVTSGFCARLVEGTTQKTFLKMKPNAQLKNTAWGLHVSIELRYAGDRRLNPTRGSSKSLLDT